MCYVWWYHIYPVKFGGTSKPFVVDPMSGRASPGLVLKLAVVTIWAALLPHIPTKAYQSGNRQLTIYPRWILYKGRLQRNTFQHGRELCDSAWVWWWIWSRVLIHWVGAYLPNQEVNTSRVARQTSPNVQWTSPMQLMQKHCTVATEKEYYTKWSSINSAKPYILIG